MSTNPSRTLRVAADHYPILAHLALSGEAVSLPELRSLLSKYQPNDTRSPEQVVELLVQLGLLETSPDSDMAWEIPYAVGEFLRHLTMRQRLATPGQLSPIIAEIQELSDGLRKAIDASDLDRMRLYAGRAKEIVESARAFSRENYRAIVHEVMRIKTRQDKRNLRERYLFISDLHDKHLKSLAGLVEVGGETDLRTAELLAVVRYARETLPHDPFVAEWTGKISTLTSAAQRRNPPRGENRRRARAKTDEHPRLDELRRVFASKPLVAFRLVAHADPCLTQFGAGARHR